MSITATYALVKRIKEANKHTDLYGSDFDQKPSIRAVAVDRMDADHGQLDAV